MITLIGIPFHPDQQTPSAPCPLCVTEQNDHTKKALFYINGTTKGEYDSSIPDSYFQTPPVALGGTIPGFDAMLVGILYPMLSNFDYSLIASQFQYLSLIRFGFKIHGIALRSSIALRRWEERKSEIVRSLSHVAPLRKFVLQ